MQYDFIRIWHLKAKDDLWYYLEAKKKVKPSAKVYLICGTDYPCIKLNQQILNAFKEFAFACLALNFAQRMSNS